jgi:hypothetical protein
VSFADISHILTIAFRDKVSNPRDEGGRKLAKICMPPVQADAYYPPFKLLILQATELLENDHEIS